MPDASWPPENLDQMAALTDYLAQGGTFAELNEISEPLLEATYDLAYQQYSQGHYREAAKRFRYLCFYNQWNPKYFIGLGACQQMMKVYGQAIQSYDYAYRLSPDNILPVIYIGDCYNALKQDDIAIEAYRAALDRAAEQQTLPIPSQVEARVKTLLSALTDNHKEMPNG